MVSSRKQGENDPGLGNSVDLVVVTGKPGLTKNTVCCGLVSSEIFKGCRKTSNSPEFLEYFKTIFRLATQSPGLENTLEFLKNGAEFLDGKAKDGF